MLCRHSNIPVIVCLSLRIYTRTFQAAVLSSAHTVLEAAFLHLEWHLVPAQTQEEVRFVDTATPHNEALKPALSC